MKVLHLSFHKGCINDLNSVCQELNIDCDVLSSIKGCNTSNTIEGLQLPNGQHYNITMERATMYWNKYKDYFNSYDCIVTSDTVALSRIFLQNNWNKKLIIWICNRFDYTHHPVIGGSFPDNHFYSLLQKATKTANVHIIGYTPFETIYARLKGIDLGNNIIKPTGNISITYKENIQTNPEYNNTIFVPPYHNDTKLLNLKQIIEELGFKCYSGKYNGPYDLCNYRAVVHIPYAWSNLAFFEMFQLCIVYFIPSLSFLKELMKGNFFWSPPLLIDKLEVSEWYLPEHKDYLIYFDSWKDLQQKIQTYNYDEHKAKQKAFGISHSNEMILKWKKLLL